MRGHGCVVVGPDLRRTVYTAIYLELNAKLQMQAEAMSKKVKFLTKGEVTRSSKTTSPANVNRAWENWCRAVGPAVSGLGLSRAHTLTDLILRRPARLEGMAQRLARAS